MTKRGCASSTPSGRCQHADTLRRRCHIAVNDPLLQNNSANFTIAGDGAEPTDRRAQLHVGVEGLGAVLLGGATWHGLAVAGLARADNPAALAVADRLFAVPDAPYAGFFF